jgi:inorganic pyrophosphatase
MSLNNIDAGRNPPEEINAVIEIPANGDPIKYEVDKKSGALFVDRFMSTAMHYPCNYGYVPHTLGEDGDPVDILVVAPYPVLSGSVIRCRPIGMMTMTDEAGEDAKLLAVPTDKLSALYRNIKSPQDLPEPYLQTIAHFFQHYKDLEPGKWVKVHGWKGVEEAKAEIMSCIKRYKEMTKAKVED